MLRLSLPRCLLLALLLCLGTVRVPAQEPEMVAPPLPAFYTPPPPDPETLPPPPPLAWDALPPRDAGGEPGTTVAVAVPPPQLETPLAPPPAPVVETPLPGGPDPGDMELARPEVEIWRGESEWPQIPERQFNQLARAYVTGTEPIWLRVQFDPLAAGKNVYVKPGRGITLQPPNALRTVSSSGECLVLAVPSAGFIRSHVVFYCQGVKTVLPVVRAPLAVVAEMEEETGGGR